MPRRLRSLITLAIYIAVAVVLPALHVGVHALGIVHDHDPGAHRHAHTSEGDPHALVEALGLHDVSEAGVARVDCTLAEITLVSGCEDAGASLHETTFASQLHHDGSREPSTGFDPEHGRGSAAHLSAALLTHAAIDFATPLRAQSRIEVPLPFAASPRTAVRRPRARSPPGASA